MRVTDRMLFDSNAKSLQRNQLALFKAAERSSAEKRVLLPSDDPVASAQILNYNKSIIQIDQHVRNMGQADEFLSVTYGALSTVADGLQRVADLALEMSNAARNSDDRRIAAGEIKHIFDTLTAVANTGHRGQHIFAGNKVSTKPFNFEKEWQGQYVGTTLKADAFPVTTDNINNQLNVTVDGVAVQVTLDAGDYNSGEDLAAQIMGKVNDALLASNADPKPSVTVQFNPNEAGSEEGHLVVTSNRVKGRSQVVFNKSVQGDARLVLGLINGKSQLSGEEYLGDSGEMAILIEPGVTLAKNIPGARVFNGGHDGVDVFASLLNLKTSLETSNFVGMQTAITDMEKATDQVSNERALIGARLNRLDQTRERLGELKFVATEAKLKAEGSDDASVTNIFSDLIRQQTALQASLAVQARILQQPTLLSFLQ